jgi:hypothetical protein
MQLDGGAGRDIEMIFDIVAPKRNREFFTASHDG